MVLHPVVCSTIMMCQEPVPDTSLLIQISNKPNYDSGYGAMSNTIRATHFNIEVGRITDIAYNQSEITFISEYKRM
jgi:hypothetical protein